jgi:hypothetical protein
MLSRENLTLSNKVWQAGYTFGYLGGLFAACFPMPDLNNRIGRPSSGSDTVARPLSSAEMENRLMKAVVSDQVVAQSNDVIEVHGYQYFPAAAVRLD